MELRTNSTENINDGNMSEDDAEAHRTVVKFSKLHPKIIRLFSFLNKWIMI